MRILLLFFALMTGPLAWASQIKVAAAADLRFALEEVVKSYQVKNPGQTVEVVYGASGKLAAQIKEGAPFDLFFSADTENAENLVKWNKAEGKAFAYASGHLALWTKNNSPVNLDKSLKCLLDPNIKKIAIANPLHAPYGKIAKTALEKSGIYEKVSSKIVQGENIAQTAQFIESGAADIGLIAMSLAQSPALRQEGRFIEVDPDLYPQLIQSGVILKTKNAAEAAQFQTYFLSEAGRKILRNFGLTPVD